MSRITLAIIFYFFIKICDCLWSKGVVHYSINKIDYDFHSQDIITSTLAKLQKEICVKFFNIPYNYNTSEEHKILFISNPEKRKFCPQEQFVFNKSVVDMPIGYKCLNERDVSKIVTDMLKASIQTQELSPSNSLDLMQKFHKQEQTKLPTLLTPEDRNYINKHYHDECGEFVKKPEILRSYSDNTQVTAENQEYYKRKLWPLGLVMYGVASNLYATPEFYALLVAMRSIERASCVVFQYFLENDEIIPNNFLWFGLTGDDVPQLGIVKGNQTLKLLSMLNGTPGHTAHTLNLLMRILGIPMMSNRYDRDNYVTINWKHIYRGMEYYFERAPIDAILKNSGGEDIPYDYTSVTHAPVNYFCHDCSLGDQTVTPIQDHLWQKTLSMGHRTELSDTDIETLNILYNKECLKRYMNFNNRVD